MAEPSSVVDRILDCVERILDCVERIPPGWVMSYGDVAEYLGAGAARTVGMALAAHGGIVPWHRVVRADGSCAERIRAEQLARLRAEGVPVAGARVVMAEARWDGRAGAAGVAWSRARR